MLSQLQLEDFIKLGEKCKRVVVHKEIAGDRLTPVAAYLSLKRNFNKITLLESNPKNNYKARFSYLCFEPEISLQTYGDNCVVTSAAFVKQTTAPAFELLRKYQRQYAAISSHKLSQLAGGMVGFLSYDAVRLIEKIPDSNPNADEIPDVNFSFYNCCVAFEHRNDKVVISTVTSDITAAGFNSAMKKIDNIINKIVARVNDDNGVDVNKTKSTPIFKAEVDDASFANMVIKAKEYINQGDAFQVVLSRKFKADITVDAFSIYRALRVNNPSPYMFFLDCGDYQIAGSSPEKLVTLENGVLESCPLAGTRPINSDADITEQSQSLLQDEKELAEHMMLVDLSRNDLGKVATIGSVNVTKLKEIECLKRVIHISSTVNATINPEKDALDALQATFPAGTLSGAPKIRAMEIIDELENSRRGIYGGTIAAIDNQGNVASCIAIRMATIKNNVATVAAGAGVVFDSEPAKEADETRHKARAVIESIDLAHGGL